MRLNAKQCEYLVQREVAIIQSREGFCAARSDEERESIVAYITALVRVTILSLNAQGALKMPKVN